MFDFKISKVNFNTFKHWNKFWIVFSDPPGIPYLQFSGQKELAKDGINKVIIKEKSSFTVTCKADGYPPPVCSWNVQNDSNSQNLSFVNISKEYAGIYKCFAENVIKRSFPTFEVKKRTSTALEIEVLRKNILILNVFWLNTL